MIFYEVIRGYRGKRRVLYEGDNRKRAEQTYRKAWLKCHSGGIVMAADGTVERAFGGGYNRTRW